MIYWFHTRRLRTYPYRTAMAYIELLTVLVGIAFVAKVCARLTNTVDVLWYIVLGMVATRTVTHVDAAVLEQWSLLGVVFIMFYAGWRENLPRFVTAVWHNKWVSLIGAVGPFVGALLAFSVLGFSWNESVVAGFVFTATAVPYAVSLLTTLGLRSTRAAQSALAAAMADSFLTIFLSVGLLPTFALLQVGGGADQDVTLVALEALRHLGLVAGAFALFGLLGFVVLPDARVHLSENFGIARGGTVCHGALCGAEGALRRLSHMPGLRAVNEFFLNVRIAIPLTLLLLFGLSWVAHVMGLHPAIGAYLTGLILHAQMYHDGTRDADIGEFVPTTFQNLSVFFFFAQEWIGPFFFIHLGSQVTVASDTALTLAGSALAAALVIGAFQFVTAATAGRLTARLPVRDAVLLGIGMLPRDVLAFVVLGIAASVGLVSTHDAFVSTIIVTVLLMNLAATIGMRLWKPVYHRMPEHD